MSLLAQLQCLLEVRESVFVVALGEAGVADVVQANRLHAFVADFALNLQGLLIVVERLVVVAFVVVEIAQIEQRSADAALVADFATNVERLGVACQGRLGVASLCVEFGDFIEADGHAALLSDLAPNGQRLLQVAHSFLGLVELFVAHSQGMQSGGVLFLVVSLHSQTARPLKIVDSVLRITAHHFHSAHSQQCVGGFRISLQNEVVPFFGFVEDYVRLVKSAERHFDVEILGRTFGKVLVIFDGLGIVVRDAGTVGQNQIPLARRQVVAEIDRFARRLVGVIVVTQCRLGFTQLREGQRELRILRGSRLKRLDGFQWLALSHQLNALVYSRAEPPRT